MSRIFAVFTSAASVLAAIASSFAFCLAVSTVLGRKAEPPSEAAGAAGAGRGCAGGAAALAAMGADEPVAVLPSLASAVVAIVWR